MHYTYKTKGTCSSVIDFDIENGTVINVKYTGGCNGNLQAVSKLVEGRTTDEVISKLKGIKCGMKQTSCADQLACAVIEALEK